MIDTRLGRMLALRFIAALLLLGVLAGLRRLWDMDDATDRSLPLVLTATVLVAVIVWALQRPLERLGDALTHARRVDGYQEMLTLLQRMSTTLPVEDVVPRLAEVAARTVRGPRAEVRLWIADGEYWAESWPEHPCASGAPVTVDVAYGGHPVGEIEVEIEEDDLSSFDRTLLNRLTAPAGLALSTVRLSYELRRRVAELQELTAELEASSGRLRSARRREQSRLYDEVARRVIHEVDAAQDLLHLVELAEGDERGRLADEAVARLGVAHEALRHISRGVFPPMFGGAGLAAALDTWLEGTDLSVRIRVDDPAGELHRRPEVERCVHLCAVALMADAAHRTRRMQLGVTVSGDDAVLELSGERLGELADEARTAVCDRLESFDGRLDLGPDRLIASIPLALGEEALRP